MQSATHSEERENSRGWLTSLAFWLCLFSAAALYAAVVLSPRLLTLLALQREHDSNQWRLVALKSQVDHLQKVIDAQRNDPAFVRELARSDFHVADAHEQRIPVDRHLRLNIETARGDRPAAPPELPWYAPLLSVIADSRGISTAVLSAAAVLVLYGFTFLHVSTDAPTRDPASGSPRRPLRRVRSA